MSTKTETPANAADEQAFEQEIEQLIEGGEDADPDAVDPDLSGADC